MQSCIKECFSAMADIRGKRPMIISRSTFVGQGHYGGHWSGDVFSTWEDMKYTIPRKLDNNKKIEIVL